MSGEKQRDYEVGYGKPPHHRRFRRGQSGNPKGRPPGAKNLKTLLNDALNEPVIVTENGGRRKLTKRTAIIKQVVNQSTKGDLRAMKVLFHLVREIEGQTDPASPETFTFTAADEKVIEQLRAQFSRAQR